MSNGRLVIVGASGRAAAASAIRAGYEPFVIDLFADADTKRLCPVLKCPMDEYPFGLVRLAMQAPPGPWMYTGGLENHPDVVATISEKRELFGCEPYVLQAVRHPEYLFRVASAADEPGPRFQRAGSEPPTDSSRWVRKPCRGAGGSGVRFAMPADWSALPTADDYFLQEFVPGRPMSAVFRGKGEGRPNFVGLSHQLVGCEWLHAASFAYCGTVVAHPNEQPDPRRLAGVLSLVCALTGVWGIDLIVTEQGRLMLIEVNPRYPASAEVYEYATGIPALRTTEPSYPTRPIGKAIYFAPMRLTFPASGPWDESLARCTDVWRRPDFADIPEPGTVVEPGHPVLTILTDADTEEACLDKLKERAAKLDHLFVRPPLTEEPCPP